jgi:putative nucleotidyltransferase with HDIG domain
MASRSLRDELLAEARTVKVLPAVTTIVDKIFRLLNDQDSSFNQLMEVVGYDQAITSKIISIANSAFYGRGVQIMTLKRAMISIGFDEIRSIVTCLILRDNILRHLKLNPGDLKALWMHVLSVACSAEMLAAKTGADDPEKVFTASLLHDLGKVILYMHDSAYRQALDEALQDGKDACAFERGLYGVDHEELGASLALKWRLPEEIAAVISHHHGPVGEAVDPMLRMVRIVDTFCMNSTIDLGIEGIILSRQRADIEKYVDQITELLESV